MKDSMKTNRGQPPPPTGEITPAPAPIQPQIPATTFTKVDNNLTSIGFFTASSSRSRKAIEKTTILVEHGVERRISILPSAKYGMPITQDQDYWLALMKLVGEWVNRNGKLANPFIFTTAELRHVLGQVNSGQNYEAVNEWLSVMNSTAIEGGSFNAARKTWCTEKTHAVDRVVIVGKQLPDGRIADKNHIWFSEWQLDNINSGNLIPIELATYIKLKTNIAKNLVPHLQEWLFASQRDGRFEKRYVDVCHLLGIRLYRHRSEIERKLAPSLNELVAHGYISKWALEPMSHDKSFKLVFWHGAKYHTDRRSRAESRRRVESPGGDGAQTARRPRQQRLQLTPPERPVPVEMPAAPQPAAEPIKAAAAVDETLLSELGKRGIGKGDARKLLARLAPGQPVIDQLEYADSVIYQSRGRIKNPPGFYISRLLDNSPNPEGFETSAARKIRQEAEAVRAEAIAEEHLARLMAAEEERNRLDAQLDALPEERRQALFKEAKAQLLDSFPSMARFFKAHPHDAINDDGVRSTMRQLMVQGY
jgi:Replication initiator protein A